MIRLLRPILAVTVRRVLRGRFSHGDIQLVLDAVFKDYEQHRLRLPREKASGGRLMVHFAALTAGLYRTLCGREVSDEDARRLTAEATWLLYEKTDGQDW